MKKIIPSILLAASASSALLLAQSAKITSDNSNSNLSQYSNTNKYQPQLMMDPLAIDKSTEALSKILGGTKRGAATTERIVGDQEAEDVSSVRAGRSDIFSSIPSNSLAHQVLRLRGGGPKKSQPLGGLKSTEENDDITEEDDVFFAPLDLLSFRNIIKKHPKAERLIKGKENNEGTIIVCNANPKTPNKNKNENLEMLQTLRGLLPPAIADQELSLDSIEMTEYLPLSSERLDAILQKVDEDITLLDLYETQSTATGYTQYTQSYLGKEIMSNMEKKYQALVLIKLMKKNQKAKAKSPKEFIEPIKEKEGSEKEELEKIEEPFCLENLTKLAFGITTEADRIRWNARAKADELAIKLQEIRDEAKINRKNEDVQKIPQAVNDSVNARKEWEKLALQAEETTNSNIELQTASEEEKIKMFDYWMQADREAPMMMILEVEAMKEKERWIARANLDQKMNEKNSIQDEMINNSELYEGGKITQEDFDLIIIQCNNVEQIVQEAGKKWSDLVELEEDIQKLSKKEKESAKERVKQEDQLANDPKAIAKRAKAAKAYLEGNKDAWNKLSSLERRIYNTGIIIGKVEEDQRAIEQQEALLKSEVESFYNMAAQSTTSAEDARKEAKAIGDLGLGRKTSSFLDPVLEQWNGVIKKAEATELAFNQTFEAYQRGQSAAVSEEFKKSWKEKLLEVEQTKAQWTTKIADWGKEKEEIEIALQIAREQEAKAAIERQKEKLRLEAEPLYNTATASANNAEAAGKKAKTISSLRTITTNESLNSGLEQCKEAMRKGKEAETIFEQTAEVYRKGHSAVISEDVKHFCENEVEKIEKQKIQLSSKIADWEEEKEKIEIALQIAREQEAKAEADRVEAARVKAETVIKNQEKDLDSKVKLFYEKAIQNATTAETAREKAKTIDTLEGQITSESLALVLEQWNKAIEKGKETETAFEKTAQAYRADRNATVSEEFQRLWLERLQNVEQTKTQWTTKVVDWEKEKEKIEILLQQQKKLGNFFDSAKLLYSDAEATSSVAVKAYKVAIQVSTESHWEEAKQKAYIAKLCWGHVTEAFKKSIEDIDESSLLAPTLLKEPWMTKLEEAKEKISQWNNKIEECERQKNQATAKEYEEIEQKKLEIKQLHQKAIESANTAKSVRNKIKQTLEQETTTGSLNSIFEQWNNAIQKAGESGKVFSQILDVYHKGQSAIVSNKFQEFKKGEFQKFEQAKAEYSSKVTEWEAQKNQWIASIKKEAEQAAETASEALEEAQRKEHGSKRSTPAWDKALVKAEDAMQAWNEICARYEIASKEFKSSNQQCENPWSKELEYAEDQKNRWTARVVWREANRRANDAVTVEKEALNTKEGTEASVIAWRDALTLFEVAEEAMKKVVENYQLNKEKALVKYSAEWIQAWEKAKKNKENLTIQVQGIRENKENAERKNRENNMASTKIASGLPSVQVKAMAHPLSLEEDKQLQVKNEVVKIEPSRKSTTVSSIQMKSREERIEKDRIDITKCRTSAKLAREKTTYIYVVGKTSWSNVGQCFDSAAVALERAIEAERTGESRLAQQYREASNRTIEGSEYFTKAITAYKKGNINEGDSLNEEGLAYIESSDYFIRAAEKYGTSEGDYWNTRASNIEKIKEILKREDLQRAKEEESRKSAIVPSNTSRQVESRECIIEKMQEKLVKDQDKIKKWQDLKDAAEGQSCKEKYEELREIWNKIVTNSSSVINSLGNAKRVKKYPNRVQEWLQMAEQQESCIIEALKALKERNLKKSEYFLKAAESYASEDITAGANWKAEAERATVQTTVKEVDAKLDEKSTSMSSNQIAREKNVSKENKADSKTNKEDKKDCIIM